MMTQGVLRKYNCRQKSTYSNGTASAETIEGMLCIIQVAVRPANVSRRACALVDVTDAIENVLAVKRLCRKLQGFG